MIELFINKLPADLPADFSFSMEYENEFFTKASEYSLDIELPLLGSPNNQKIFGNIHRVTTPKSNVNYEAVAYVNGRCVSHGYALILSVTDRSVKIQLVGNTSYVNSFCADEYIDEMDLGYLEMPKIDSINWTNYWSTVHVKKTEFYKAFGSVDDTDAVLFWAFDKDPKDCLTSFPHSPIFNHYFPNHPFPSFSSVDSDSELVLIDLYRYSFQPYLLRVIEKMIRAMGFTIRRNDISHTWLRNLYICNYKPTTEKARNNTIGADGGTLRWFTHTALPHWTVSTFINEVEKLCACIFIFNTYNNTVDIIQLDKFYGDMAEVYEVPDDAILDEYEFEFSDDESDKDLATGNISFSKDYTDKFKKFSQEIKDSIDTHNHYSSFTELESAYNDLSASDRAKVLFIDDSTGREYICHVDDKGVSKMLEVNIWSDLVRPDSSGDVQLKIVPANTRDYGVGWWFDMTDSSPKSELNLQVPFSVSEVTSSEYTNAQDIIENSYTKNKEESNDCMEVMLSTGQWYPLAAYGSKTYEYPAPFADFNMPGSTKGKLPEMSLSLKDVCEQSLGHMYRNIPSYRSDQKFMFRFLPKTIPDARQPYRFHNQLYVCRKLNADFANSTKDLVFEGEFYRLK